MEQSKVVVSSKDDNQTIEVRFPNGLHARFSVRAINNNSFTITPTLGEKQAALFTAVSEESTILPIFVGDSWTFGNVVEDELVSGGARAVVARQKV